MTIDFSGLHIAVVGSLNLDIVARVPRFPRPGETLSGARVTRFPGGKGGNQALAAHRLGARVTMLACIGDDPAAAEATASLRAEGVLLDRVQTIKGESTGLALICVTDEGENQIVVAPGANAAFDAGLLNLPECDAVIAQLEVPLETVVEAASRHRGLFCLNAAPARPVSKDLLDHVDLLVVNEIESEAIGEALNGFQGILATTLGARGARLSRQGQVLAQAEPPRIRAVDTTGAGDAFTAALTVCLAAGMPHPEALQMACNAGALTATRDGAQSSPSAAELAAVQS
ncbi:MAG: ribokinase [Xanthomonadales bacterium]|nr:ribokinase [Xanthomonadales bacterium]